MISRYFVPKKLGIPVLIGYFFLQTAQSVVGLHNSMIDTQIKSYEKQLKELDLFEKLQERESLSPRLPKHLRDAKRVYQFLDSTDSFTEVKVDSVTIITKDSTRSERR